MPDITLHGNGKACPGCELRREASDEPDGPYVPECNQCGGVGRIARPVADIVAEQVKWARKHYWPGRFK